MKKLYKIRSELGELQKWFYNTANELVEKKGDMPSDIRATWARKVFRKICLEKTERALFAPEVISERERVEL